MGPIIGKGCKCVVREATALKTNTKVAIKGFTKKGMSAKELECIYRERDILQVCHHQNVIDFVDFFETPSYAFTVIELANSSTLADYCEINRFSFTTL